MKWDKRISELVEPNWFEKVTFLAKITIFLTAVNSHDGHAQAGYTLSERQHSKNLDFCSFF